MLRDETCWFLAADFDKSCWREDVLAFTETCRRNRVPYAIERSLSGNGAHVWFFFSNPIAAVMARKMGSYLITETMASRHQLSMTSYDRLFPNQDTLPNRGFGNLIALPLQCYHRQEGNTVFLERHPRAICRSAASTPPWKTRSKHRGLRRQQGTDARENIRKTACRLSSYGVSGRRQRNVIGIANKTQRHFHFRLREVCVSLAWDVTVFPESNALQFVGETLTD
jgi:hypothetical protein